MQNPGFLRRLDGWSSCQQKPHDQAGTFPLKVKDFYDEKFSLGRVKIAIFQCKSYILAKSVSKRKTYLEYFANFETFVFWLHLKLLMSWLSKMNAILQRPYSLWCLFQVYAAQLMVWRRKNWNMQFNYIHLLNYIFTYFSGRKLSLHNSAFNTYIMIQMYGPPVIFIV